LLFTSGLAAMDTVLFTKVALHPDAEAPTQSRGPRNLTRTEGYTDARRTSKLYLGD